MDPLLGPIGGGLGLVAVAPAGATAVARAPSEEDVSGAASSAALTTSLEPAFLIGKKDTEFLDEETPADAVTLDVKTKAEDADIIAIFGDSFLLLVVVVQTGKSEFLDCFVGL